MRATTAPLPQACASSAQEGTALPKPGQVIDNPFSLSPYAVFSTQKPAPLPPQDDAKDLALFQPLRALRALTGDVSSHVVGAHLSAALPQRQSCALPPRAQAKGAANLQAAPPPSAHHPQGAPAPEAQVGGPTHDPKRLPPRGPGPARRSTTQRNLETAVSSLLQTLNILRGARSLEEGNGALNVAALPVSISPELLCALPHTKTVFLRSDDMIAPNWLCWQGSDEQGMGCRLIHQGCALLAFQGFPSLQAHTCWPTGVSWHQEGRKTGNAA